MVRFNISFMVLIWLFMSVGYADLVDDVEVEFKPAPKIRRPKVIKKPKLEPVLAPASGFSKPPDKKKCKIEFKSQGLKGSQTAGLIELRKRVFIRQCELNLNSDNAKLYFDSKQQLIKIIATGQVVVRHKNNVQLSPIVARGHKARFIAAEGRVYLYGKPATLKRESNMVKGKLIVYELETGWVSASNIEGQLDLKNK